MSNLLSCTKASVGKQFSKNIVLAEHTTFRLGGPADYFYSAPTADDLVQAVNWAREKSIPYFILGAGANVLVADEGYRGLVLKPGFKQMQILGKTALRELPKEIRQESHRQEEVHHRKGFLSLEGLDEDTAPLDTLVRVEAGAYLPQLIRWSFSEGLTGLELFAGIPATLGGGIYNNIHGGTRLLSPFIDKLRLLGSSGEIREVGMEYLQADYDYTLLHETKEIVLSADLLLSSTGDVAQAQLIADEWKSRKLKTQPQTNTAGCIFRNISPKDQERLNWPSPAVGYLFDKVLGLKDILRVGGAHLSPLHANFIVHEGDATAKDVLGLMQKMKDLAKTKFDLDLVSEIVLLGFDEGLLS